MLGGSYDRPCFLIPIIRQNRTQSNKKKESGDMYDREYLLQVITRKLQEASTGMLESIYYYLL